MSMHGKAVIRHIDQVRREALGKATEQHLASRTPRQRRRARKSYNRAWGQGF